MAKAEDYHTVESLRKICKRKIPNVAFSYLESGTDKEILLKKNTEQFDSISFIPRYCLGVKISELKTELFGFKYDAPIGIAPVGLTGLIWPNAEKHLSLSAFKNNIPFCLSTVATMSPEEIDPRNQIKTENKWFQLYPPKDLNILDSLLERAVECNFSVLVVTVDIPAPSRRERSKHAGLNIPLKFSSRLILDGLRHPKWTIETLFNGLPRLKTVESYTNNNDLRFVSKFVGNRLGGSVNWDYIKLIRNKWKGPMVIKGLLSQEDALLAKKMNVDGVYVSNHGGRQFDGGVSCLTQLKEIRQAVGPDFPLIYDSGIRSGLDVFKAINFGANFVFAGRPFMYGLGAFKEQGVNQVIEILKDQLRNNMMQLGLTDINEISELKSKQV